MADTDTPLAPEDSLSGPHYDVGGEIARGAFGVILTAQDLRVRRGIVIKTPIAGAEATARGVRRFVQEARILARLEHPNIVPVHGLAVDSGGAAYYTMKHVQGTTLRDALAELRDGNAQTLALFPLSKLLLIFGQICDAAGFAHSQGIIHRDLKPDNVMLGEFGEVLVMDWGLAKMLRQPADEAPGEPTASPLADPMATQDGTLVGTPAYMAPEQAAGRVSELDERTDIYALGAILYQILTLRPPVTAGSSLEAVAEAQEGRVTPALFYNSHSEGKRPGSWANHASKLPHCPGARIPTALAAVAMKALSAEPAARYQTVPELQADVAAYLGGFATGAEQAGFWQSLKLTIKRRKVEFAIAAVALVAAHVVGGIFLWKLIQHERQARAALAQAEDALEEIQRNIPAMRNEAVALINAAKFSAALPKLGYLSLIAPDSAEFPALEGNALQSLGRYEDARAAYQRALERDGAHKLAKENLALCDTLLKARGTNATLPNESFTALHAALMQQGRAAEAALIAPKLDAARSAKTDEWRAALQAAGLTDAQLATFKTGPDGKLELNLDGSELTKLPPLAAIPLKRLRAGRNDFSDLTPLAGMALEFLNLGGTSNVSDLRPLRGMPLKQLDANQTHVTDLSPLAGMPIEELNLDWTPVKDLTPLQKAKLTILKIGATQVSDLRPIQGQPLTFLSVAKSLVTDLSPLKGMKLETLNAHDTKISDLGPLAGMPLRELTLYNNLVTDLRPLAGAPLTLLHMWGVRVSDLSPLKGAPLRELSAQNTGVTNLGPLQGMPLESLDLRITKVTDLSPLRGMTSLRTLLMDNPELADLAPLKGIPLTKLQVGHASSRIADLSPLRGMPLEALSAQSPLITNLYALQGMPLKHLDVRNCRITDLRPLRGMPLTSLMFYSGRTPDLQQLQGLRLTSLNAEICRITDISALRGMPLTSLSIRGNPVADLRPLQGMRLTILTAEGTSVTDLAPLKGMPLKELTLANSKVTDLAPLAELRDLERLSIPQGARNLESLRRLPKLTRLTYSTLGGSKQVKWPDLTTAEQFWAQYDAAKKGAPKK